MSEPLPFYDIPLAIRFGIVNQMDVREQFNFSMSTKFNYQLVENVYRKKNFEGKITVRTEDDPEFLIEQHNTSTRFVMTQGRRQQFEDQSKSEKLEGADYIPKFIRDGESMIWLDRRRGIELMLEYFKKVLHTKVDALEINKIVNWHPLDIQYTVNAHQGTIDRVKAKLDIVEPKELQLFLENLKGVKDLTLFMHDALTIDQLLDLDCEKIALKDATRLSRGLNKYLKKWLAGDLPNLRHLHLDGHIPSPNDIDGIKVVNVMEALERPRYPQPATYMPPQRIKRRNGRVGTLFTTVLGAPSTASARYMIDFVVNN